jgi:glycerol-3-phosphate acyltransferase PlsX
MTEGQANLTGTSAPGTVLSIDAMGGDLGPAVVVAGMAISAAKNPNLRFILHGPQDELTKLVARLHAFRHMWW